MNASPQRSDRLTGENIDGEATFEPMAADPAFSEEAEAVSLPPELLAEIESAVLDSDPAWELVARIGRGDQAALATLYRQVHGRLGRFVMRVIHDEMAVDDVINETMMVVWQKAADATPRSRVSTWIFGIAYRKALKAAAKARRGGGAVSITEEMTDSVGELDGCYEGLESDQLAAAAMQVLPKEQRAVMELVYHEGLNYSDIAAVLECPENTVKTRVFHARRKLRLLWPSLSGQRLS